MIQEGKKDRSAYLGSHDLAAISGYHPFMTAIQVYMNKLKIGRKGDPTEPMYWGLQLEQPILEHYELKNGFKVNPIKSPIMCERLDYLGATPDGMADKLPIVVDVKNIRFKGDEWGEEGTDEVPRYVLLQAHTHLLCTGAERCDIAALFSGQMYKEYTILRDTGMDETLLHIARTFWNEHIIPRKPPDLDHTDSTREFLRAMFPKDDGEVLVASKYEAQLMNSLGEYMEKEKDVKKTIAKLRAEVCSQIGAAKGLEAEGIGKAVWFSKKGGISYKKIAESLGRSLYGDDYAQNVKYKAMLELARGETSRQFRFTPKKKDS
jgi:putative phage-type endonuclease